MVLVRGSEPNTKVGIGIETAFGTAQTSGLLELPITSETLTINSGTLPESQEIRSTGALSDIEDGRNFIQGTITIRPKYNSQAQAWMMCRSFGGMEVVTNFKCTNGNSAGGSDHYAHLFTTQAFSETTTGSASAVPPTLTIYVWKSGVDTSGTVERFRGCTVTGWTWNQPEYDHPTLTFNIIGIAPTDADGDLIAAGSAPALTLQPNLVDVLGDDGGRISGIPGTVPTGSLLINGASANNIRSWSIELEGNYSIPDSSLRDIDTFEQPGHDAPWSVRVTANGVLDQDWGDTSWPIERAFNAEGLMSGANSAFRVYYTSATMVEGSINYHCDLLVDSAIVVDYTNNIEGIGEVPYSFELRGILGSVVTT